MKALRWHGRGDVRLDEVEPPGPPADGEVQLAVGRYGICGTDVEEWRDGPFMIPTSPHPLSGAYAPPDPRPRAGRARRRPRGPGTGVGTHGSDPLPRGSGRRGRAGVVRLVPAVPPAPAQLVRHLRPGRPDARRRAAAAGQPARLGVPAHAPRARSRGRGGGRDAERGGPGPAPRAALAPSSPQSRPTPAHGADTRVHTRDSPPIGFLVQRPIERCSHRAENPKAVPDKHSIVGNRPCLAPRFRLCRKISTTIPQFFLCDMRRPRGAFRGSARTVP